MQLKHFMKRAVALALALLMLLSLCACDAVSAGNAAINAMEAVGIDAD